uniref:Uncharacterized protein n=1 Tax=Aegilops tauschii TaxID=37682 RepID=M8C0L8_AEGTA
MDRLRSHDEKAPPAGTKRELPDLESRTAPALRSLLSSVYGRRQEFAEGSQAAIALAEQLIREIDEALAKQGGDTEQDCSTKH